MAFEIVWTKQAVKGYDNIVTYLAESWTEREVMNFITRSNKFFRTLSKHPEMLQKTDRHKNLYRGPINPLTILTYRVIASKKQIVLVNIRGARQKPLK